MHASEPEGLLHHEHLPKGQTDSCVSVCAGLVGQIRKSFDKNEREERIQTVLLGSFIICIYYFFYIFYLNSGPPL